MCTLIMAHAAEVYFRSINRKIKYMYFFSSFINIDTTLGLNTNINLTTIIIKLNLKKNYTN